jgi:hypothetical protein
MLTLHCFSSFNSAESMTEKFVLLWFCSVHLEFSFAMPVIVFCNVWSVWVGCLCFPCIHCETYRRVPNMMKCWHGLYILNLLHSCWIQQYRECKQIKNPCQSKVQGNTVDDKSYWQLALAFPKWQQHCYVLYICTNMFLTFECWDHLK